MRELLNVRREHMPLRFYHLELENASEFHEPPESKNSHGTNHTHQELWQSQIPDRFGPNRYSPLLGQCRYRPEKQLRHPRMRVPSGVQKLRAQAHTQLLSMVLVVR